MQRRGGGKRETDDDDCTHHHHLPSFPPPATARRSRGRQLRLGGFGLPGMLLVAFTTLLFVEHVTYRMLEDVSYSSSASWPVEGGIGTPPSNLTNDGIATEIIARDPSPERPAEYDGGGRVPRSPEIPPTNTSVAAMVEPDQTTTYEPTNARRLYRLRGYESSHVNYSRFWKTRIPDPVPPLPPDTDPSTGRKLPPVIAYVTTLTDCRGKYAGLDGAAVLLHSIRRNSYGWTPQSRQLADASHGPRYGGEGGRYRHVAYAFVDPAASPDIEGAKGECARYLRRIGYTILHRASLVPLFEVKDDDDDDDDENGNHTTNRFYEEWKGMGYVGRDRPVDGPTARRPGEHPKKLAMIMSEDGCCGYAELLKLHVYGMVEHVLAVHLDFDSLLLRPMDDLFDIMLGNYDGSNDISHRKLLPLARLPRTKDVNFSRPIDAAFTRDYNQVNKPGINAPVGYQGGFLVVRPDLDVLERYRTILKRGEFVFGRHRREGWGGRHGGFYGDVTFQGILPYYYEDVAPAGMHNEAELDRCIYNQMGDNPRKSTYKFPRATPLDPKKMGFRDTTICRDGRTDCSDTDCQRTHPKSSITAHFTFCKKPWDCPDGNPGTVVFDTCSGLLEEWYRVRRELEDWWLSLSTNNSTSYYWKDETLDKVRKSRLGGLDSAKHLGYCDDYGNAGYRRLVQHDEPNDQELIN